MHIAPVNALVYPLGLVIPASRCSILDAHRFATPSPAAGRTSAEPIATAAFTDDRTHAGAVSGADARA
jgi:hypothetical protein